MREFTGCGFTLVKGGKPPKQKVRKRVIVHRKTGDVVQNRLMNVDEAPPEPKQKKQEEELKKRTRRPQEEKPKRKPKRPLQKKTTKAKIDTKAKVAKKSEDKGPTKAQVTHKESLEATVKEWQEGPPPTPEEVGERLLKLTALKQTLRTADMRAGKRLTKTQGEKLKERFMEMVEKGEAKLARKPGGGWKWIQVSTRFAHYARDDFKCTYCGAAHGVNGSLTLDHLTPNVHGGKNTSDNLVTCCSTCNSSRQDDTKRDWYKTLAMVGVDVKKVGRRVGRLTKKDLPRKRGLQLKEVYEEKKKGGTEDYLNEFYQMGTQQLQKAVVSNRTPIKAKVLRSTDHGEVMYQAMTGKGFSAVLRPEVWSRVATLSEDRVLKFMDEAGTQWTMLKEGDHIVGGSNLGTLQFKLPERAHYFGHEPSEEKDGDEIEEG